MLISFLLILALLMGSLPGSSSANVRRVPQQYPTIQSGIDAAASNDTISISPGEYFENINFRGKEIVVRGDGAPESVVVNGSRPAVADSSSVVAFCTGETQSSVLQGLTLTGGSGTLTPNGMIGGGIYVGGSSPVIKNCTVRQNHAGLGGGIGQWGPPDGSPDIVNCLIFDNSATGGYGGGVWLHYSNGTLEHCTIARNSADYGSNLTLTSFASTIPIRNSILWTGSIYAAIYGGNFSYCAIQGGWPSGTANIDADPLFCNPSSSDFHLAANSPCLGTGESSSTIGALDVGCDSILSSVAGRSELPRTLLLSQNYPNPFNPVTVIAYDLPGASRVVLSVLDLLGRRIAVLVDGVQQPGRHEAVFDAGDFSSGVYIYQLKTDHERMIRRMVLQR